MIDKELLIYQAKDWEIVLKEDSKNETIWANLNQIATIFDVQKPAISKHLKNIYSDGELEKKWTISILETVQKEWNRIVKRNIEYYNLDVIISVWYRVNSKKATKFRIWASKILKEHITQWFTLNKNRILQNYDKFIQAIEDVKKILLENSEIKNKDILELVKAFANTWLNLEIYDENKLPTSWFTKENLEISAEELYYDVEKFKKELIKKWQATNLFAQEKIKGSLKWILWNVFQSFDWCDLYSTIEEKVAHLLYFIVKDHPFDDGNKRTWAFSLIWFLQKIWFEFRDRITPEALTILTLMTAESNPKDKNKIIGLIILLFKK